MRSLLLPISMMVMLGLACCRASSSQLARWLKVSRLQELLRHEVTAQQVDCNFSEYQAAVQPVSVSVPKVAHTL